MNGEASTHSVLAEFDDGESGRSLDVDMYGVTGGNMWALLQANSPPLPAAAAAMAIGQSERLGPWTAGACLRHGVILIDPEAEVTEIVDDDDSLTDSNLA